MKLPPSHLGIVKQQDRESLIDYITRFMDDHIKVVNCTDNMTIIYFTDRLNDKNLVIELGSKPAMSLNDQLI